MTEQSSVPFGVDRSTLTKVVYQTGAAGYLLLPITLD